MIRVEDLIGDLIDDVLSSKSKKKRNKKKGGLYKPPKHKKLADIVTYESVSKAKKAAKELKEMFRKARTRKEKLKILRATQYAANRARASAERHPNFSQKTREKWRKVADVYERASDWMQKEYEKSKRKS